MMRVRGGLMIGDRDVCGTMSVLWLGGVRASHLLTDVSVAVWHMWSGCALSL